MSARALAKSLFLLAVSSLFLVAIIYAQAQKEEPIIINGDTVEYLTEGKEVTASGDVSVIYKGAKLTCRKLTINTQTKDAEAEGNVRLEDNKGVIEGERMKYNFQTKVGTIMDAEFRSNPYFGRSDKVEKVSDSEFIARHGYMTTCSHDEPHYRIRSGQINFFPDDKVQTKDDVFYVGRVPVMYAPQYNHSLKDPLMHVQLVPGKSKDWGLFMLSAWRYDITDDVKGRIFFDYRSRKGVAEGFGTNYSTQDFGRGDFKYYYTQERDHALDKGNSAPRIFQRYFIRWRHKADIDEQTNLVGEYYKITDSKMALYGSDYNFLKDYFFREYEKDTQPPSYLSFHHSFIYSSLDFLIEKRTNRWYDPGNLEKLPEIEYTMVPSQIFDTPLYFETTTSAGSYIRRNTSTMTPELNNTSPSTTDEHVNRFDTTNKFSLPMRVAFVSFTPFVANRETFYSRRAYGSSIAPRTVFYSGADLSTKFYRVFNLTTNALGLDINGLRHIITPTVGYRFNHEPTVSRDELRDIDEIDEITRNNSVSLGLINKLQTKRDNHSIDLAELEATSNYNLKPKNGVKRGSSLSDFFFRLKVIPYSWMTINADATYVHSGERDNVNYNRFSNANYDLSINFGEGRSFTVGQRYQLKGGNEITCQLDWRLNPKWKFSVYQRRNRGHDPRLYRGLREQQYTISRDLHCWVWDISYNVKRGHGETIWFIFRLKAFPEVEFQLDQSYHEPKPGSQSRP